MSSIVKRLSVDHVVMRNMPRRSWTCESRASSHRVCPQTIIAWMGVFSAVAGGSQRGGVVWRGLRSSVQLDHLQP